MSASLLLLIPAYFMGLVALSAKHHPRIQWALFVLAAIHCLPVIVRLWNAAITGAALVL